jgi:two-component system sensor histidine kinase UhpB
MPIEDVVDAVALESPELAETLARVGRDARDEEARRIARELHDEAGQLLSSVFLVLHQIEKELSPEGRARLAEVRDLVDKVEGRLRRLSHELHPTILEDLGLLPALVFLADGFSNRIGAAIRVAGSSGGRLPAAVELAAYRAVQEALKNVGKHAGASSVTVEVERRGDALRVTVCDDGVGFAPQASARVEARGLGFVGIRERLEPLGGRLEIRSSPGHGTRLSVEIPSSASAWRPASS